MFHRELEPPTISCTEPNQKFCIFTDLPLFLISVLPKTGSLLFKSIYFCCIFSRLIQLLLNPWRETLFLQVLCMKCWTILVRCTGFFFLHARCFAGYVIQLSPLSLHEMTAEVRWREKFIHSYCHKNLENQLHNHGTAIVQQTDMQIHTKRYTSKNHKQMKSF